MKTARTSGPEPHKNSPADRTGIAAVPRNNRSRITNGALGVDLRSKQGRRWRDVYSDAMRETGGRHETLCKQAATLIVQRERMDAALARGEDVDVSLLIKLAGAINRTLTRLGLDAEHEPAEDGTQDAIDGVRRHFTRAQAGA